MQFKTWVLIFIREMDRVGAFVIVGAYPVEYNNNNNNNHNNGQVKRVNSAAFNSCASVLRILMN